MSFAMMPALAAGVSSIGATTLIRPSSMVNSIPRPPMAASPPRFPMAHNAEPRLYWVAAQSSGTRSRVLSLSASRKATTASSSFAVPLSRSPRADNAEPRLFCIIAHWSGTRSRVLSLIASRKATTASSSFAVPVSRSPRRHKRNSPDCSGSSAQSSGTRSRVRSLSASRKATTASSSFAVPLSRSPRLSSTIPRLFCVCGPIERHTLTGHFLQRLAKCDDSLFELGCSALALPEHPNAMPKLVWTLAQSSGIRSRGVRSISRLPRSIADRRALLSPNSSPC